MFCAKSYKEVEQLGIIERANIKEEMRRRKAKAKAERIARTHEFCENELSALLERCAYTGETAVLKMAFCEHRENADKMTCGLLVPTAEQYADSSKVSMTPDYQNNYDFMTLTSMLIDNCYKAKTKEIEYYEYGFGKRKGFALTIIPKECEENY